MSHLQYNKLTEMNKIFTSVLVLLAFVANAQTADSALSNGGAIDVYYDFETGVKTNVNRTSWDIGLASNPRSSSIIINENAGVELYLYGSDTSMWSTVDTTGFAFTNIYNSEESWAAGAFSNQGTTHPDYGWGIYDGNTHDINGNRIFIIKTQGGDYLKVVIDKMAAATGIYTFRTAKLDGSDFKEYAYSKSQAESKDKNFALLNLSTGDYTYTNPDAKDWDVVFTKYITFVQQGPNSRYMAVGGLKINDGYDVAERDGVDVSDDDTSSLSWNTDITEIGYDWKSFDLNTSSYTMVADRAYFIRTSNGAVWKLWFTNYTVGTANYYFNTKLIKEGTASIKKYTKLNTMVYPNPSSDAFNINNGEKEALTVTLLNTQGVTVLESNVNAFSTTSISTLELSKGVYFLRLNTTNATSTQRVIFE
ncbi:MAG: hypothetical protein COA58_15225 [Bacteroidetes bacterium]|nr:MAG: hypothetical protein COA58_15225 [Bacteroidota bacterium]